MRIGEKLILGHTLAQHVGGRWAISWIAYAINLPINMVGTLANVIDARGAPLGAWLLMWAVGYAALGAVLLVANLTLFRHRRFTPVPVWWVVALGAVAGGARGTVVGLLADSWGLSGGGSDLVITRILTGAFLGAIMIPAAALFLSVFSSYATQRRALLDEIVELERQRMQSDGETERLRMLLAADVQAKAGQAVGDLNVRTARDVSHRIWNESVSSTADPHVRIGWVSVIRDVFTNYPYPGLAVAAIWSVSAGGTFLVTIGVARGVAQLAFSVLVIWGGFALAAKVRFQSQAARLVLLVITLTLVTILTGPVASALFDPRAAGSGSGLIAANFMWLPVLSLILGVIVSAIRSSEEVLTRLSVDVRAEEVAAIAAAQERGRIQREMAEALHGIQSRIFAARAAGTDVVLEDFLSESLQDNREQFTRLLSTWGGLMALDVDTLPDGLSEPEIGGINRVVSEALSNAYRHGSASRCNIGIDADLASVSIEVIDNGSGVSTLHETGLGSRILDSVCDGEWALSNSPGGGAVLRARISR